MAADGIWFVENITPGWKVSTKVKDLVLSRRSKFQMVSVLDLEEWGKTLVLDGVLQSSESDEFIYHELLVHPAMVACGKPKSVYIGGGGEGATAREVLRFKSVERLVMVDIDELAVKTCREELTSHHKGAFDDPRMHLVIDDAKAWLQQHDEKFDVIIMDLADPLEEGPCWQLYTKEFYTFILSKLNPGGVFVTQCGQAGMRNTNCVFSPVRNTLKSVFKNVRSYAAYVPSFQDSYGFTITSNDVDLATLTPEAVAAAADGIVGENKFYDDVSHTHAFSLPKYVRDIFATENRVGTLDNPQSFYKNA
mmetsp:Transcript_27255/g.76109  ORF Transcript_27255/g.76109 Transcript_27255/m.76109 type:complete len:307 (-) Transcript_27255:41-961(-)|eukprot:CAMPEP_0119119842 /NCGR_PEP_ID=MMETSP1310-20130426/1154_1 /TAXON_ID=464262 /ORGANISM="Genus nov. species nov., Strain RCC2339" /LENGTH=306 /DNA_ID=CAMNT_0007109297 /DNA_START=205 /DNA_END=1125 /DNA_ORIENTATION=+